MYFENDIDNCLVVLRSGGLILYPTDTVWGIGCDATNQEAVERVIQLKERPLDKSMIILLSDEKEIPNYVNQENLLVFDYIKGIHKPATMIYNHAQHLAPNIISSDGSVGIRITNDPFCKQLLKRFGKPIVSTSSNISGFPTPGHFADIDLKIKQGVDYVVEYRQDDLQARQPSTIIKVNQDGSFRVLRP
jgi:L-threonylcarbamoyladenylate synthase